MVTYIKTSTKTDVVYFFILYFSQDRPVVGRVGLSDVDLNILGGRRPDQLLESDQPVLVLVEDCHPGPVEEQHHILQQVITSHTRHNTRGNGWPQTVLMTSCSCKVKSKCQNV